MKNLYSKGVVMIMIGIILQSCLNDTSDYSTLSIDDFKDIAVKNVHKWENAPEDQHIGAIYSQQDQYAVFMPMDSCKMHFYDTPFNYLYSRVSIGNGPGEFTTPDYCGQWKENTGNGILTTLLDTSTGRLIEVSAESKEGKIVASIPQKYGLFPGFMVSDHDNKHLYGVSSYLSCELGHGVMFVYDIESDSMHYSLPTFEVENKDATLYLMQKATAAGHDCQLFVNAYIYEPVIELLDNNMKLLKSLKLKDVDMVDSDFDYDTSISFFRGVQIGRDYIYVLYYGRPYGQPGSSYVLAFDHSGSPVYKINVGDTYWFTINESTDTIIMMRRDKEGETMAYIASLPSPV